MDNSGDTPRGKRFKSAAANAVFAAFCALDVALQWDFLQAVQERLAVPKSDRDNHGEKVRQAIAALRVAAEILGASPSLKAYERLRKENPAWDWPPARSLKRWLGAGNWNDVLERAHLDRIAEGEALALHYGPAFAPEEVSAALRECASELGYWPSFNEYIGWARRADVRGRPGRRPMSQGPFSSTFGTFAKALKAATGAAEDSAISSDRGFRVAGYFVGDKRIRLGLREVAKRLGRPPRTQEYIAERKLIHQESSAAGSPRALPSYGTICRRYGSWDAALADAGLTPLGGRATGQGRRGVPGRKGARLGDTAMAAAILEAHSVLGEPFSSTAYSKWRLATIKKDPSHRRELPSYHTIWKHFGSWEAAVRYAFASEEHDANPDNWRESA
jgi:hypothetical protein